MLPSLAEEAAFVAVGDGNGVSMEPISKRSVFAAEPSGACATSLAGDPDGGKAFNERERFS